MPSSAFTIPSPTPPTDPVLLSRVQDLFQTRSLKSPIYAFLLSPPPPATPLTFIHCSPGLIIARIPINDALLNSGGSMHGGAAATLVDWAGGMAISSTDGRRNTGVSVDIHVEYLAASKMGDTIEIEGRAERVGGSIAYTTVGIYKVVKGADGVETRGEALVLGRHTKFVRGTAPKPEEAVKQGDVIAAKIQDTEEKKEAEMAIQAISS